MHDDKRGIRIKMWTPVREVFLAADALFQDAERLRGIATGEADLPSPAPTRGRPPPPPTGAPAGYLRLRGALREAISAHLDPVLTEHPGPWEKHLCVTAIVSFIDERERVALGALAETWRLPLFQTELLGIDDGGDRCFTQLQELLLRSDVHEMVLQVHLLCLRAGFVGRFRDRRHERDQIVARVVERLSYYQPRRGAAGPDLPPAASPPRSRIGFIHFPLRYYLGVAVLAVAAFATLRIVSTREVERSNLAEDCHYRDGAP